MNTAKPRAHWSLGVLTTLMGLFFVLGGGWMMGQYWFRPEVKAEDFSLEKHDGVCIQLMASRYFEAGFQVKYDPDKPGSENDISNRVARLLAVPVGNRLLIVRVPLEHKGNSFLGIVKKLTPDIETGILTKDMENVFKEFKSDLATLRRDMAPGLNSAAGPIERFSQKSRRKTPRLREVFFEVYVDAKSDERWAAGLMILVGLATTIYGIVLFASPKKASTNDDSQLENFQSKMDQTLHDFDTISEIPEAQDPPPTSPNAEGALTVQCSCGHSFQVDSIYRGAARKCPRCDEKVDIPVAS